MRQHIFMLLLASAVTGYAQDLTLNDLEYFERQGVNVLVFSNSAADADNGDGTFAYQDGADIIVTGDGTLQVFDVMGRLVMTKRVNGVETINLGLNGVYILKMNGMTQKIVVR